METPQLVPEYVTGLGAVVAYIGETTVARAVRLEPESSVDDFVKVYSDIERGTASEMEHQTSTTYDLIERLGPGNLALAMGMDTDSPAESLRAGLRELSFRTEARRYGLSPLTATIQELRRARDQAKRAQLANKLDLPLDSPWPVIRRAELGLPADASDEEYFAAQDRADHERYVSQAPITLANPMHVPLEFDPKRDIIAPI